MEPPKIVNNSQGEEDIIEKALIDFLTLRGWFVKKLHGNLYQFGMPDLYCTHSRYGVRLIEVKKRKGSVFTPAQLETFPKLIANGSPIWILVDATEEEYKKLWKPSNYWQYCFLLGGCR
jgi:hypothetical protein